MNFLVAKENPTRYAIRHATAATPFQISTDGFKPYRSAITTERQSLAQSPEADAPSRSQRRAGPLSPPMTERQWELYRLSVVDEWHGSPHKAVVIGAIKHKLMILALQEKTSIDRTL